MTKKPFFLLLIFKEEVCGYCQIRDSRTVFSDFLVTRLIKTYVIMKRLFKFLIIFPILALSIYVHAQEPYNLDDYKVVGNTVCIVNYSVQVIDDTVNMEHRNTNRFVLECCNNISKFYSYNLYVYDSLYTESINKGKQTYPCP